VGTKVKAPRQLISHRSVAPLFGTSARNWRRWYLGGVVPIPHQQIGTLLLYDKAVIDHRLETGVWPEGVVFRGKAAPKGRTAPCAAETPTG
jgi:hypothetical protein